MKVTINTFQETRKIVAVQGDGGNGLFVPDEWNGGTVFVSTGCMSGKRCNEQSLADVLSACSGRKPIYEGDEVTIQF